jgi:hypothetical protein
MCRHRQTWTDHFAVPKTVPPSGKIDRKKFVGTLEINSGFSNWIFAASGGAGRQLLGPAD